MMDNLDKRGSGGATAGTTLILYQDDSILAVNKPAGLPSLPDGYDPGAPHLKSLLETEYGRLWIVHRLDRDTSGVILLARTVEAHRILNDQFEARQVRKRYHAVVCGHPKWKENTVRLPLRPNGDRRHRTVVDSQHGKAAETEFCVLEIFGNYTLLEAQPHTGRTHQIRAHLAAQNLPILCDGLYGGQPALFLSMLKPGFHAGIKPECPLIQRCALHAYSLEFFHPKNGSPVHLEAPYPKDFQAVLRMLRRYPVPG